LLADITPVVLTRDEEANIARTLGQLRWAPEVIVVDSFSADGTVQIARNAPNVRVLQRHVDTLAGQSSFGIAAAKTPWVLLLDADYFLPDEFIEELRTLHPSPNVHAYTAGFRYAIGGRPLRASLYPPRIVLLHREHARVWQDGHAHRVAADGEVAALRARIIHDDRKSFARFVQRQRRYMKQEAAKLRAASWRELPLSGRLRKLRVVAPLAVVAKTLFVDGLILDGIAGLHYAFERFVAEALLSAELLKRTSAEGLGNDGRPPAAGAEGPRPH
jgi:glycosyltransferase involved in cell wall biosynthesis